jgi:hypothetical protein
MRQTGAGSIVVIARYTLILLVAALGDSAAAGGQPPRPVSPGAARPGFVAEARCPTFSWAGVNGAEGYELAVFQLLESDLEHSEPTLVLRTAVPGDARSWTPPMELCLERGERYAWSVAAASGASDLEWADSMLFEIAPAASLEDLEAAVAALRLSRSASSTPGATAAEPLVSDRRRQDVEVATILAMVAREPRVPDRVASTASTPTLGPASLSVSQQVHLAPGSSVFKGGLVFLWDDADGNTALGRGAMSEVTDVSMNTAVGVNALRTSTVSGLPSSGSRNSAFGYRALETNGTGMSNAAFGSFALSKNSGGEGNTAVGDNALSQSTAGSFNTAMGLEALQHNETGSFNTAIGERALQQRQAGASNTAVGALALANGDGGTHNTALGVAALMATSGSNNTALGTAALQHSTGSGNIAVGYQAGSSVTTGTDNILIGASGIAAETNTLRIGNSTAASGEGALNRVVIHGIRGRTPAGTAQVVVIGEDNRLGSQAISSSARYKEEIADLGDDSARLRRLRPVKFFFKQDFLGEWPRSQEYGLIAEEVAEVFPELVLHDGGGLPSGVRYPLLSTLLLHEVQRQHSLLELQNEELELQNEELELLRRRLEELERTRAPTPRRPRRGR